MRVISFILVSLLIWACTSLDNSPTSTQTPVLTDGENSTRSYEHEAFRIDLTVTENNTAYMQVFFEDNLIQDRLMPFGSGRFSDDMSLFVYQSSQVAYIWRVETGAMVGSFTTGLEPYGLYTDSEFILYSICESTRAHGQCTSSQVAVHDSYTGEPITNWVLEMRDVRRIIRNGQFVQISGCEVYKYDMFADCRTQNTIERELPISRD